MNNIEISFFYECDFSISNEEDYLKWIELVAASEKKDLGELNYIFCSDEYLHEINVKYLDHDTLTDIISFDNTIGNIVSGDIFISVDRVKDNAGIFDVSFENELKRVMAHGILHFCGYKDKTKEEKSLMRSKEEEKIELF